MRRILVTCLASILPLSYASASDTLNLVGSLESKNTYSIVSEIDGVVASFGYERGEKIRLDQPLVIIRDQDQQLILQQAQANLNLSQADLKAKKAKFERYKKLEASNNLAKDQLDDAEAAFRMSQSAITLEKVSVKQAELDLDRTRIEAQAGLWVAERSVNTGDWVQKGQLLYQLENTQEMKAVVHVTETQVAKVKKGLNVTLIAESMPEKTFIGKIARIGIKPDALRNSYPVDIVVDNSQGLLRPGFTVDAMIRVE